MGTLVRTKNLFIAISLVKLNHSHRKYSREKFYRRIFLKCETLFLSKVMRRHPQLVRQLLGSFTLVDACRKEYNLPKRIRFAEESA